VRIGTYGYNQAFPEFRTDSLAAFIEDCRIHGVRYLLLTPDASDLSPAIGRLYLGAHEHFKLVGEFGEYKILRIDPGV
jgi:hypothetical protein